MLVTLGGGGGGGCGEGLGLISPKHAFLFSLNEILKGNILG